MGAYLAGQEYRVRLEPDAWRREGNPATGSEERQLE